MSFSLRKPRLSESQQPSWSRRQHAGGAASLGVSDLGTHPSSHPAQGVTKELPWQDLNRGVPGSEACTFPNKIGVSKTLEYW